MACLRRDVGILSYLYIRILRLLSSKKKQLSIKITAFEFISKGILIFPQIVFEIEEFSFDFF